MKLYTHFTKFNQNNGLSSSNIRKILNDQYGFIWVATQDGLNRFDGNNFLIFNSTAKGIGQVTFGSDFHDIVLDKNNNALWAATSNGALNEIDINKLNVKRTISLHDDSDQKELLSIKTLLLKNDTLYAGCNKGYIFQISANSGIVIQQVNLSDLLGDVPIRQIIEDDRDQLWIFTRNKGVLIIDKYKLQIKKHIDVSTIIPNNSILTFNAVTYLNKNEIITATDKGLIIFNTHNYSLSHSTILEKLPSHLLTGITTNITVSGHRIYFSNKEGLFRFDVISGELKKICASAHYTDKDWLENSYAILPFNGSLWLGNQQGLSLLPGDELPYTAFQTSFDGNNVTLNHCYHLLPKNDSVIYICSSDGLYKMNTCNSVLKKIDGSQVYYQLIHCPDGNIIASGEKNIKLISGNNVINAIEKYSELSLIQNDFIIASASFHDSLFFLASQLYKGLYIWDFKQRKIERITLHSGTLSLKDPEINNLFIDQDGNLGIVCKTVYSVYNFRQKKITHNSIYDPSSNAPAMLLMDVCQIKGKYYFADYGKGVIETSDDFKTSVLISSRNGITSSALYKIYSVGDTSFIASSNDGLFIYNTLTRTAKRISEEDGIHSNSFDETSGNIRNDELYLGGLNGFTIINLSKIKRNDQVPILRITSVEIKNKNHESETQYDFSTVKEITVPNNYTQINISFSGLIFASYNKVSYAYKISELNKDWISIGNQPFIKLIGVSPGSYHLQIQAFNEDGIASNIAALTLTILPQWYETWWFKSLLALTGMAIIFIFYHFRITQLTKEQQIRSKIARDLHDDLGSTMNSVKVYASLALMENADVKYLAKIKEGAQQAISSIRDIIWVLDDSRNNIDHLIERLNLFASPLCEANAVEYTASSTADSREYMLGNEEKRNLYMILKEAVNNVIKYAHATNLSIAIKMNKGKPEISIEDNGIGFDVQQLSDGNGLKNMSKRAMDSNYDFQIESKPDRGTFIYLKKH